MCMQRQLLLPRRLQKGALTVYAGCMQGPYVDQADELDYPPCRVSMAA